MAIEEKNLAHAAVEAPEELAELQAWWNRHGNRASTLLLVALAALLAYNGYGRWRASRAAKASLAYAQAQSAEALEAVVEDYHSAPVTPLALLRIGNEYYHRQKHDLALEAYETFLQKHARHEFAPIAIIGVAHVVEAQGLHADAEGKFRAFAENYPEHYLAPLAVLGQARCLALQGRRDEANSLLDRLMADRAGTAWSGLADDLLAALPRLSAVQPQASFMDALQALDLQSPAATQDVVEAAGAVPPETPAETAAPAAEPAAAPPAPPAEAATE